MGRSGTLWRGLWASAAGAAALAGSWEAARRRDVSRLEADPDRDVLDAPLPGRATRVTSWDGTRLAARIAGPQDAPATVVLAHGWGMGSRFWIHQLRELARRHRVIAYDQRGHADSEQPASRDYSIEALAGDLGVVVEQLATGDRPLLAVGHSLGGMSTLAATGNGAGPLDGRLDGAVLVDTAASHLTASVFAGLGAVEEAASAVGARALRARLPVPRRTTPVSARATRLAALGPEASPAAVALTEQLFLDCPVDVRAAVGASLGALDLNEHLPDFTVPTTVVVGTSDRLTPPGHARRLVEALPEAELVELDAVGHQAPLEQPEAVNEIVARRLEELTSSSRG
jgi:pimeloyl-ACP methyl ester carboxylesterase